MFTISDLGRCLNTYKALKSSNRLVRRYSNEFKSLKAYYEEYRARAVEDDITGDVLCCLYPKLARVKTQQELITQFENDYRNNHKPIVKKTREALAIFFESLQLETKNEPVLEEARFDEERRVSDSRSASVERRVSSETLPNVQDHEDDDLVIECAIDLEIMVAPVTYSVNSVNQYIGLSALTDILAQKKIFVCPFTRKEISIENFKAAVSYREKMRAYLSGDSCTNEIDPEELENFNNGNYQKFFKLAGVSPDQVLVTDDDLAKYEAGGFDELLGRTGTATSESSNVDSEDSVSDDGSGGAYSHGSIRDSDHGSDHDVRVVTSRDGELSQSSFFAAGFSSVSVPEEGELMRPLMPLQASDGAPSQSGSEDEDHGNNAASRSCCCWPF